MGFLDRLIRRRASGAGSARSAVSSAAVVVPPHADSPGSLPGAGPAQVGDVALPPGRPVHADPGYAMPGEPAPPGPALWITDGPVADAPLVWQRLVAVFPTTGLWPLLCGGMSHEPGRPWDDGELAPVPEAAIGDDVEGVLSEQWEVGDEALAPFDADFPRLARRMPEPAEPVRVAALRLPAKARIGLVPCRRPADAPALVGWLGPVNVLDPARLSTVLRSWEERIGALVVGLDFDVATLVLTRPPVTDDDALAFAAEVAAACPDAVQQGTGTLRRLADGLRGERIIPLWWD